MNSNSRNVKLPFLTTRCQSWGVGRSASWSANINYNTRNVKLSLLTTRCHYMGVGRSASSSASMNSNSTSAMGIYCHSVWPLDDTDYWCGRCSSSSASNWTLGGTCFMGICAFFYIWHWFGVVVFQRSMFDWSRQICQLIYQYEL